MHSQCTSYRSVINFQDVPNKAKRPWANQSCLLAANDVKPLAGAEAMVTFGFAVLEVSRTEILREFGNLLPPEARRLVP
jgi:hypothetical protein